MFKSLITLVSAGILSFCYANAFGISSGAHSSPYERILQRNAVPGKKSWQKESLESPSQRRVTKTTPDGSLDPVSSWGVLYTPKNETWMYTMEYSYADNGYGQGTIEKVDIHILDSQLKEYSNVTMELTLTGNETTINSVELVPTLSKKFFNYDDAYEIMVFVHATTSDYVGNFYTKVFSLKDGKHIMDIQGNNIGCLNTAPDEWSENYTMVFMREEVDAFYNMTYYFDVFKKAGWGGDAYCDHTFEVDYSTFAGADGLALPFLMNSREGKNIYYALPHYEKPFFDYNDSVVDEDGSINDTPAATADNNFIIDLYDNDYQLIKTTKIPMSTKEGYLYSFPGLGELTGYGDLAFDYYSDSQYPVYYVATEHYVPSMDSFVSDIDVYDVDGTKLCRIFEEAEDYLYLNDIDGQEMQFCFYKSTNIGGNFYMVDVPSGKLMATVNPYFDDGNSLTTTLDRCPVGDSYMYVSSLSMAETDLNDNALHKIAWIGTDGQIDHYDTINLGNDVALAIPYINQNAFDPYLFNTDSAIEYMFLLKRYRNVTVSSANDEYLRIYGSKNNKIYLELGPDADTGKRLNSIFLLNQFTSNAKLICVYLGDDEYTITHFDLPLQKFDGGDGSIDNPYRIATAGDFCKIYTEPSANYIVVNDIDFADETFKMNAGEFNGTLEGCGHTIRNLTITDGAMFESLTGNALIKSLKFEDCHIDGSRSGGFIALEMSGESPTKAPVISDIYLENCTASGNADNFGGIAGNAYVYSKIEGCVVKNCDFQFDGYVNVGGILGNARTSAKVSACYFSGKIQGYNAGGILGYSAKGDEKVVNCQVNAEITAEQLAGGIIGYSKRTFINNCFVEGSISATGSKMACAGGIAGEMEKTYDTKAPLSIQNNIVAASSITANQQAETSIAHRILGRSSIDIPEVDWDNVTDNMSPADYPYLPATADITLSENYAIGLHMCDASAQDIHTSLEGQTIAFADITDEFLSARQWIIGENYEEPWIKDDSGLRLFMIDKGPTVGIPTINGGGNASNVMVIDGTVICAPGLKISVYNVSGALMASGIDRVDISHLGKGVYIAKAGSTMAKFAVK